MTDRFEPIIRGAMGFSIACCLVAAAFTRPAPLPPQARTTWVRAAAGEFSGRHVALHSFVIDALMVGKTSTPYSSAPFAVVRGTPVQVVGWAFDPNLQRTANHFIFRVDGGAWREAKYHLARPDVAAALGVPGAADCGFAVEFSTNSLSTGPHKIQFATVLDNESPMLLTDLVALNVNGH